jgi:ATP-binding cassette subfamily B protein
MKKKSDVVRMLKYFKTIKSSLVALIILTIIYCLISIVNPIINANLLTSLTDFNVDKSIKFALFMIEISLVKVLTSYLTNIVYIKNIKQKLILGIRKDMIRNVFNMETVNFEEHSSGEFTNRITNDPEQASTILSVVQFSFFNLITDIFILIYVIYINYILGIIYVISFFVIYVYEKTTLNKVKKLSEQNKKISDKNAGLLNEVIRGIRDIKTLNITRKTHNMVIKGLDEATRVEGEKSIKSSTSYDVVQFMQSVTVLIIILVGIFLVDKQMLTVTNLIIIYMYRTNVYDLSLCYRSIKEYLNEYSIACKRIFEFMDNNKYTKETFGNKELTDASGKIELKNLSFAYDKKKVLKDIDLVINPNDTIGIVGESGSGKTTLLNLLSKSYKVGKNKILIDGIDINDLTKDSIRNNIAVISQNPYIFNLTIKENLELISDDITKEDIVNACKVAQIHDYIMTLPDKYDTIIGEGGTNLSGGQKQRLAIARALLKKSKIILFDEATSALDNVTQNELQKSINNISDDYTIIIVAHRLSTIKDCNKIYVMEKGEIVGAGTHKELLKNNKQYKKLYNEETA